MSPQQSTPGNLGFKLSWTGDQTPVVTAADMELVRQISVEVTARTPSLASFAQDLHTGLLLPYFWEIVKVSNILKRDFYRWWHLDECAKHLLASWIIAQENPKMVLVGNPLLWEIYPTMILGSLVEARISVVHLAIYNFNSDAEPMLYYLSSWLVNVDKGCCILFDGVNQLSVDFGISELSDSTLIRLIT